MYAKYQESFLKGVSRYRVDKVFYFYDANTIEQNRVEKGHNFAVLGRTEKKIGICLCFALLPCIKFQVPSISHSVVSQEPKSGNVTCRQTEGQTNMPPNIEKVGA